ncbi:MAG: ribosome assembly RNA-binding protein YhbY [Desulfobacteraceae bacterium]|jgi:RNA-binding protein|nr:ribosome assembly RNA-binding protein YhbY [Desulfobacteraceae bacterium]
MTKPLKGIHRRALRGLAHNLRPVVQVGQKGVTEELLHSVRQALDRHELIKVQFLEPKEKEGKKRLSEHIAERTGAHWVGMVGHVAIFFRRHPDPSRRKIRLPDDA